MVGLKMLSASLEELSCFSLLRLSIDEELELDAGVELELSTVVFFLLEDDSALVLELEDSSSAELKDVSSLEEIGLSLALLGSSPQATKNVANTNPTKNFFIIRKPPNLLENIKKCFLRVYSYN